MAQNKFTRKILSIKTKPHYIFLHGSQLQFTFIKALYGEVMTKLSSLELKW